MKVGNLFKLYRDWDRALQLLFLNEEFLVIAGHQPAMITSLPFVKKEKKRVYLLQQLFLSKSLLLSSIFSNDHKSWVIPIQNVKRSKTTRHMLTQ